MDRFVSIARIVKARGIKGEVSAEVLTDFPERFASLGQVRILCRESHYWESLERYWFHQGRVILKFRGRDVPEAVRELIGGDVQIRETERIPLSEGTYYDSDLMGCQVREKGLVLGEVTGVLRLGPETSNLVISTEDGKELMIPMVAHFITRVDIDAKRIDVVLPPGLKGL